MVDMRETLLAFGPRLKLMTYVLTPGVGESRTKKMYDGVEGALLFIISLAADNCCLDQTMDGDNCVITIFVDEPVFE